MKRRNLSLLLLMSLFSPGRIAATAEEPPSRPLILVHVMPWFEAKPVSGAWGWHWTMNKFDPEKVDASGKRDIASHLYPLIGPYDSADPDVLEYHALLMKVAGIDGAVADWYGRKDFNDYAMIHKRTELLFASLRGRGLKFAVCYEDRTIRALVEKGKINAASASAQARRDLEFGSKAWFRSPSYLTWAGQPLLMVFGPDYLDEPGWKATLAGLKPAPAFFTLHEPRPPAIGSFAWPPMWASKDGVLDRKGLDEYLDRISKQPGLKIAGAFPGFHDIYQQAGTQPSHGYLDPKDGETFRYTLSRALASGSPIVQVATWNDFGEGTCIEPTREHGYRDLETIQVARRGMPGVKFRFTAEDLRIPLCIYQLRKQPGLTSPQRAELDSAAARLGAGDARGALKSLDTPKVTGVKR